MTRQLSPLVLTPPAVARRPFMTRLAITFGRIGTADSVSWTSFWVTFIALGVGHFTVPQTGPVIPRIASLLVAQVVQFLPLLVLRAFLLRNPSRPHPWITLMGFGLSSLIRGVVWGATLRFVGVTDFSLLDRAIATTFPAFLALMVAAIVVTTLREYERDASRLAQVSRQLEETSAQVTHQITDGNERVLKRVRTRLNRELRRFDNVNDSEALEALRHLTDDVIRPMSHKLARSVPTWQPVALASESPRVSWVRVFRSLGERGQFLPMTTSSLVTLIYAPSALVMVRSSAAPVLLILLILQAVGLAAANAVLDRVLPLRTPARSSTLVVLCAIAASALTSGAAAVVIGGSKGLDVIPGGVIYLTGSSLVAAVIRSRASAQQEVAAELHRSTQQLERALVRLRQAQWYHHRKLSRALHGSVQSVVSGAALRLDRALSLGPVSPELVDETRVSIAECIDVLGSAAAEPQSLDNVVQRLSDVWSLVCAVEFSADPGVRVALEQDGIVRSTVTEIMTEAMSNSIRHGRARHVSIMLALTSPVDVTLSVVDDGAGPSDSGRRGLGSAFLDECTSAWFSRPTPEGGYELRATLPLSANSALTGPTTLASPSVPTEGSAGASSGSARMLSAR